MTIRAACPSCDKVYNLDDSMRGKTVLCRECKSPIEVPNGARQERREDRPARDERIGTAPPRGSGSRGRRDEDEPPRRPVGGSRNRDRDEDSDRGRRPDRSDREEAPSNNMGLILAGVGGAVVLFIGLVVGGLVLAFSGSKSTTPQAAAGNGSDAGAPPVLQDPPPVAVPGPEAGQPVIPPGPVPAEIAIPNVQRVKQSTAFLRVNLPNGDVAEGSGFFALERGIVITNAHVLGMLRADSLPPKNVDVVINSGEAGEMKRVGAVLGVDRGNDLAVVRVGGDLAGLPPPLPVDTASKMTETQKVYIFGFPLGSGLGKSITVSPSSIASLRRDDSGVLKHLQVNGGMHHGNSGGPVTDARGVVVGVSVAGIPGTLINFAIPGDFVKQIVNGKIARTEMGVAYRGPTATQLPVTLSCLDPMNRIRQVKVDVWTGPAGAALPASSASPAVRAGDSPRRSFLLSVRDGRYIGELALPPAPAGHVVWIQPMMVNGAGASQWDASVTVPVEAQNPLDRRAAMIQFKPPTRPIERTLKLNSVTKVSIFKGATSLKLEYNLKGNVLETLQPEPGKGTRVRLVLGDCPYSTQVGDKTMSPPPEAHAILRKHTASFIISPTHVCIQATKSNFKTLRSVYRDSVSEMYQTVCNTYEGTAMPVPNRTVQPLETWDARMPMYVFRSNKLTVQDIFLTCTFEGVSTANGRSEACISLKGRVRGRGIRAKADLGKVTGSAYVDIDGGFVTRVKLTTITEVANDENDSRLMVHDESTVVRTEGNALGLTPPAPGPVVQNPPATPNPIRPPGPGSTLQQDLAALKGTWQSVDVNADGGGAAGTIKLQLRPVLGKLGGQGKIDIATKRAGRTTTASKPFSFSLGQQGGNRLLVAPGVRGTGLAFTYSFDGDQLILSGRVVVSRTVGYTLTKVAFRRVSANVDAPAPAPDPTKPGGKTAADAIKFTGDVFAFVQAAVKANRLADVDVQGFTLHKDRYRDVPDEGGVLIGFQVGYGKFGKNVTVKSWRPIFLTKTGEKFGQWQGPAPATPTTVKAKAGYVVSGMTVRVGLSLDSFIVTFAKLGKNGLDMGDTYNSEKIGGQGGLRTASIGGRGALFVGITGHLDNANSPSSLGMVAVLPKE